jgi:hypothetical protein
VKRAVVVLLLVGCDQASPPPLFVDVTLGSGLEEAVMQSGKTPSTRIVEVKGGGLGLIDFDNDGDLDVFMPNGATLEDPSNGPGARLFKNLASEGKPLVFEDISTSSGLSDHRAWSFGVAVGDVDQNGYDDLVVSTLGANRLYLNDGVGAFFDASEAWGLDQEEAWSTSVGLGDVDEDGDLDLYVVNYLDPQLAAPLPISNFKGIDVLAGPRGMTPTADRMYENVGDRFIDRTDDVLAALPARYGLNVAMLDVNDDARIDIFVGNDSQGNFLLRNDGDWTFVDIGTSSGAATNLEGDAQATMGIAVGDVDFNGRPDFYSTNFSSDTNTLHLNADGRFFDDGTARFGLAASTRPMLGWACAFGDFDLDGDEDLVVFNGHVYPQASYETMDSAYEQPPAYWERAGERFVQVAHAGLGGPHRDRTAVVADLDLDGDLDLVVGELNGPLRLIENTTDTGRSLRIAPEDPLGTTIQVAIEVDGTTRTLTRWLRGGGPFQSTASPIAHVGLPEGAVVTSIEVEWPGGETVEVGERERLSSGRVHVARPSKKR